VTTRIHLVQRHSHNLLLAHIVWTTASRAPLLSPSADAWLAAVLRRRAYAAGSLLVACGNAADHVHVLVRYPSTATVANVVQHLKGGSSYEWNLARRSPRLAWQPGVWCESVSPRLLPKVARYVDAQRAHHAQTCDAEAWEEVLLPATPKRTIATTPSAARGDAVSGALPVATAPQVLAQR
jgi:REP element-mobilizing transposase RayT